MFTVYFVCVRNQAPFTFVLLRFTAEKTRFLTLGEDIPDLYQRLVCELISLNWL